MINIFNLYDLIFNLLIQKIILFTNYKSSLIFLKKLFILNLKTVILMSNFKFSRKLTDYLKKIELDTGREIKFFESLDLGIKGITAAYNYHP
jgi:hypothetical protein